MPRSPRYDVTIYAPFAGALYTGDPDRSTGGSETQIWELARRLAARGLRVCHIVFDYPGLPADGGVDLVKLPLENYSRTWPLFVPELWRAFRQADARVYIQRTAGYETGVLATFCRLRRRRLVFATASTIDLEARPSLPSKTTELSYRWGRRLADEIVVQTEDQVNMAAGQVSQTVRLIRSFCPLAEERHDQREAFLWIGGFIDYKDPLAYVQLAERLPDARFWMIGHSRGPEWDHLQREVDAAADRLPNLEMMPPRNRSRLLELYPKAVAVVSTSKFEGFPNVFLEAWAHGTPVLSLRVDPEKVISRYGLGAVADGDLDRLAGEARSMWERRDDLAAESAAARGYIARAHAPDQITDQWTTLLRSLAGSEPAEAF